MEYISRFDLNTALRLWLERLGQSSQVKTENLKELESHISDSVMQLQTKGLSPEESFLIATHRVGSPARLEPEFGKVNRNPMNNILHGLILTFFSAGCWFLWAILHLPHVMEHALQGRHLPAFTIFVVGCGSYWAVPPLLAAGYCLYVWTRSNSGRSSWMGFFATTAAILFLLTLHTLVAILLPIIQFMNNSVSN
ncbi:MAG: permease prefix domain 1-containing protein [Limisphaerales bacterium]